MPRESRGLAGARCDATVGGAVARTVPPPLVRAQPRPAARRLPQQQDRPRVRRLVRRRARRAVEAVASGTVTAPTKRYPRRGNVSTNRGVSAESSSASRSFRTALFNPTSKSTNVSAAQSTCRSSSRATTSPGRLSRAIKIFNDCSGKRIFSPWRRSSPDSASSSKTPKRKTRVAGELVCIAVDWERRVYPFTGCESHAHNCPARRHHRSSRRLCGRLHRPAVTTHIGPQLQHCLSVGQSTRRQEEIRSTAGILAYLLIMHIRTAVLFAFMLAVTTSEVQVPGNPACVQDFPTDVAPDPNARVVMCGLDNPRGLAFSEFALFVAEAGRGGLGVTAAPCFTGNVAPTPNNRCYAPTGAISRLRNGSQERVATGFPSHAESPRAHGHRAQRYRRQPGTGGPRRWVRVRDDSACNNLPHSGRGTIPRLTSPN